MEFESPQRTTSRKVPNAPSRKRNVNAFDNDDDEYVFIEKYDNYDELKIELFPSELREIVISCNVVPTK
jgi:hypothetical protein